MNDTQGIDYAALAVKKAILEKFGANIEPPELHLKTEGKMLAMRHGKRRAEGTRDNLLAAVRKATTYDSFWEVLAQDGRVC